MWGENDKSEVHRNVIDGMILGYKYLRDWHIRNSICQSRLISIHLYNQCIRFGHDLQLF